ncbi:MAG: lamin tail domain-containing protein, partial [Bacteroidetes bacterium]|nr:lamin tail domain-containing protein [Bacteroidota bacterium]
IREKQDNDNVAAISGADPNNVDILKWNNTVQSGDDNDWNNLFTYMYYNSLASKAKYDSIKTVIDMDNYFDYFIAETYYNNGDWLGDWTNNIRFWKEKKPSAKWRYLLWDTDFGLGLYGDYTGDRLGVLRNPNSWNWHSVMFDTLMGNTEFRNLFVNRYADLMNTIFTPTNLKKSVNTIKDTIENEMLRHVKRWNNVTDLTNWNNNLNVMYSFIDNRPSYARNYVNSNFGLNGQVSITLDVVPAAAGKIKISTIIPDKLPWSGIYFNGSPVTITAIPNPGYTFAYFKIGNLTDSNITFNKNFTAATSIKAYFTGSASPLKLAISEINYNSSSKADAGNWIELHNYGNYTVDISDWKFHTTSDYKNYKIPTGTQIKAGQYLVLCEDTIRFKNIYHQVKNYIGNWGFSLGNDGDSINLFDASSRLLYKFVYADTIPWPQFADGKGYTLEHISDTVAYSLPQFWFNGCKGGSPGAAFKPCKQDVVISEINYKSASSADAGDWVELHNSTQSNIDISHWHFKDDNDSDDFVIPSGTVLPANGYLVLASSLSKFQKEFPNVNNVVGSFNFGLSSGGELLQLYDSNYQLKFEMLYDDKYQWPYKPDGLGYTLEVKDSVYDYSSGANWTSGCLGGSPGTARTNCNYKLNLSEINFNMEKSRDLGDYVELYNYGKKDLQIGKWKIKTRNQGYTLPDHTQLLGKERTLLTSNDSSFVGLNYILLNGFQLSNFSDTIQIYDENDQLILFAKYDTTDVSAKLANGHGYTLEIVSDTSNASLSSSWFAGCLSGSPAVAFSPCEENIYVSEFNYMSSNKADVGDWIELHNRSLNIVSLDSWTVATKKNTQTLNKLSLSPNERVVLISDSVKFFKQFPSTTRYILMSGIRLDDFEDEIKLYDSKNRLQIYIQYQASQCDTFARGNGYTLALKQGYHFDHLVNLPSSWEHQCLFGSPADSGINCIPQLTISELCIHPDSLLNSGKWIELYNYGNQIINLTGFTLTVNSSIQPLPNYWMKPQERLILSADSSLFRAAYKMSSVQLNSLALSDSGGIVLRNELGKQIYISQYKSLNTFTGGLGSTLESKFDTTTGLTNWITGCLAGSPGAAYSPCFINPIVCELSIVPHPKLNDGQWFELVNADSNIVLNLSSYKYSTTSSKNVNTFSNVSMQPLGRLVITNDTNAFKRIHPFAKNYVYGNFSLDSNSCIRIWNASN